MKRKFTTKGETIRGKKISYDTSGYPRITINKVSTPIHLILWKETHGEIPNGCDIHHKDFNKKNYQIENLDLLTHQQHTRIHAGWIRDVNGIWIAKPCSKCNQILPLSEFWVRKKGDNSLLYSRCKRCHNDKEKMSKYYRTDKYREKNRIRLRKERAKIKLEKNENRKRN